MAAAIAHIKTAPAAISFTSPAILFSCGETKFTNRSMEVLNASAAKTMPIQSTILIHSKVLILKIMPQIITAKVIEECIHALCSLKRKLPMPFQA